MKAIIVLFSYHHMNTEKIARAIADVIGARIARPGEIKPEELADYDLVGFGSGIYSDRHHVTLLNLVDKMQRCEGKRAFIFSTFGVPAAFVNDEALEAAKLRNHSTLRDKLISKGYAIAGEFTCVGKNSNSFLKLFGGINKGRPDEGDIRKAEKFAEML